MSRGICVTTSTSSTMRIWPALVPRAMREVEIQA